MQQLRKDRKLPILSEIIFYPVQLTFALFNVIFEPLGIKPAVSMLVFGGMFAIALVPIAFVGFVLHTIESTGVWEEATEILLKWFVMPFLVCYVVQVLILDKTHITVENSNPMYPRNGIERAAKEFSEAALDYFPLTCVPWAKDASLPPTGQYVFGVHPHGIHCTPLAILTTRGSDFDRRFPGIVGSRLTGLAATVLFKLPLVREIFIYMGYVDASRSVANNVLASGRSLFVCTGGEEESMLTSMGKDIVVLKRRKGFVRLAISHGASLVPMFGVGNSDLYHTYEFMGGFRRWLQKNFSLALPLFHGRYLSPLPYKKPVNVLVGAPIHTPRPKVRGERPNEELVDEYHAKYMEALAALHAKHVKDRKLIIL